MAAAGVYKGYNYTTLTQRQVDALDQSIPVSESVISRLLDSAFAVGASNIPDATITLAKLSALAAAQIIVANGAGVPTAVALSGDATISNAGALTIADGAVTPAKQSAAARTRIISVNLTKKLPAPTGANQLANDLYAFTAPAAGTVVSARVISDTATAGSGAADEYVFFLRNSTTGNNLNSAGAETNGAELVADTPKTIVVNQNLAFNAGAVFKLSVNILDTGAGGPTDLSTANLRLEVSYTI